jgi:hypothetical protein
MIRIILSILFIVIVVVGTFLCIVCAPSDYDGID